MKPLKIPEKLEDWDLETINNLIELRDVESETFDFKGADFKELSKHICAMANTRGGLLILGIEENKVNSTTFLGYRKKGFDKIKENLIDQEIRNQIVNIEPIPKITPKNIYDEDDKFYVVLQIENNIFKKPYFIKNKGQCFVRIGSSTTPASRSIILDLFANWSETVHNLQNLRSSITLLKEDLANTLSQAMSVSPRGIMKIPPVDLMLIRNSVLTCQSFLLENDLFGKRLPNGYMFGITILLHGIQWLNECINSFNASNDPQMKIELQEAMCQERYVLFQYLKQTPAFLDKAISVIDAFLLKNRSNP